MNPAPGEVEARAPIGRCGLFCGSCEIFAVSREPALDGRRRRMAQHFNCPPAAVTCEGCQNLTTKCWGSDCKVLKCLDGRGLAYCDECPDVAACERYAELDRKYEGIPRRNAARRRELGDEGWLAEQHAERASRRCGRPLIYGDEECAYCRTTEAA